MLRRAAMALRECRSNDIFVLARSALENAIRNEADLVELLSPDATSALPQRTDVVRAAGYGRFWFVQFQPGVRPCGGRGLADAPRAAVADELASASVAD
jgi:hypothetical protein